MQPSTIFC